jgi:ADP-ribose pyrophosphatase YjhB (NUDIX family)
MLVSAPPFGTLAFESYAAKQRRAGLLQTYRQIVVRGVIAHKKTVLAVQPNSTAQWLLPGGPIAKHESPQQALSRHIQKLTGVSPRIGELLEITPLQSRAQDVLELYYMVENTRAFHVLDMTELASQDAGIDEIAYIDPHAREDFELRSFMRG